MPETVWELLRIAGVAVAMALINFLLFPYLFTTDTISITDVDVNDWLSENYSTGSLIVFLTSFITTLLWYWVCAASKAVTAGQISSMRLFWVFLGFIPILSIGISLYFFNDSNDAFLSLVSLYIFNVIFLYWFTTAISTPNLLKYVPPLSMFVRSIIPGLK